MSFEHPAFAFGALLGAVPPLLHLLDQRRPRTKPFAAIEFLLRAQRGGERRFRLRRLLLMLMRMALLIAVPLALARPRFSSAAEAAQVASGPRATAIVIDGSGSMRYRQGSTTLFALAQREARKRLRDLSSEDPITLLLCANRQEPARAPTNDRMSVLTRLDGLSPSEEPANLATCIEQAAQALATSELPGKRIVVFSDLQQADWDLSQPPPVVNTSKGPVRPEIEVIDVAGSELPNHALENLEITAAPAMGPHGYQFTVTVRNYSSRAVQDLPVALEVDGKVVARGFCDLTANGSQRKVLGATFSPGSTVEGRVFLPPDGLSEDDSLPFVLPISRQAHALLVDGAPSSLRYLDEAFFVQTALETSDGAISVKTTDPETLTPAAFEDRDLDVVVLLNVRQLSKEAGAALKRFVEQGGGLFIALGDRVDADAFNDAFGPLLPSPLRLLKTAAPPPHSGPQETTVTSQAPAHFGRVDFTSPLFAGFAGGASEGLFSTRIYRYFLVEPPGAGVRVLASFEDGSPALLLSPRKSGRVLLFTSSAAREWTDWPIQTSFVPVVQRAVRLLAKLEEQPIPPSVLVGSARTLGPTDLVATSVRSPSGKERRLIRDAAGTVELGILDEAGLWRVQLADAAGKASDSRIQDVPVVFDPKESDTRRIAPAEIAARFGGVVRTEGLEGSSTTSLPLWTRLLLLAIAFFAIEALLGGA